MAEIKFILGRAGSGKTQMCLDLIARRLRASPLEGDSIILLVPEQATYQMERELACWRGINNGFTRAKVLSFRRLVQLIAKETHSFSGKFLLHTSRCVLMSQIIAAAQNKGELRFWNNCEPIHIAETVIKLLDELISAGLTLGELEERYKALSKGEKDKDISNDIFRNKLHDIIVLMSQYNKANTADLTKPAKYLSECHSLIESTDWLYDATIFADGFSGFTGIEYKILLNIAKIAERCFISLCLDYDEMGRADSVVNQNCFRQTEQTYARLTELAKQNNISIAKPIILRHPHRRRFRKSRQLALLEQISSQPFAGKSEQSTNTFSCDSDKAHNTENAIQIIQANNPFDEIEFVADKIIELVRDKDYRYRDISLILRSLDAYGPLIQYIFDKYEIPYFIDIRRSIGQHPLAKLIISALRAVSENFSSKRIIKYIKTGLTGIENALADKIENYVLAHGIDNDDWKKQWRYKPLWSGKEDRNDAEIELEEQTDSDILEELNRARLKIIRLLKRLGSAIGLDKDVANEININNVIEGIYELLRKLEIPTKLNELARTQKHSDDLSSQIHKQILKIIIELFSQLRITLSEQFLSIDEIIDILQKSFTAQTVGVIPSCVDQVLIGTIERSRHPAVRASFILGYNETQWPAPIKEDFVLTDDDIRKLDWKDLSPKADIEEHYFSEQYLNYIALTRPREYLWISYSRCNTKGVELQASRFLKKLITETGISVDTYHINCPLTASGFISQCISDIKNNKLERIESYKEIFKANSNLNELLQTFLNVALDKNNPKLSKESAEKLFRSKVSISNIETYYKCPFQHFCKYGLRLKDKVIYKLEPADLGILRHQVMKDFWETIVRKNISFSEITEQLISDLVEQSVDKASQELKNELLLKEARNVFIVGQVTEELKSAIASQIEDLMPGQFKPTVFEYSFDIDIGQINLIGRIDRIDVCTNGNTNGNWILVIDYKSRTSKFNLDDFFAGISLQLTGYLWASLRIDKTKTYYPAGALIISLSKDFKTTGFLNEEAIKYLVSEETGNGAYNLKLKKEGGLFENSKQFVFPDMLITHMLELTEYSICKAVQDMLSGKIDINPYYNGEISVCPYCSYRTVCRFARGINRYRIIDRKAQMQEE